MNGYLLDTNVVSETRKPRIDRGVRDWLGSINAPCYLSVIVVGELLRGTLLLRRKDVTHAEALDAWVHDLVAGYGDRVLPVTLQISEVWARQNTPDLRPIHDGLLAATAVVHDLTLVTRNVKDVAGTGVRIVNPFSS